MNNTDLAIAISVIQLTYCCIEFPGGYSRGDLGVYTKAKSLDFYHEPDFCQSFMVCLYTHTQKDYMLSSNLR